MIRGLPASIIFHASVFALAYIGLPYFGFGVRNYETEFEIVDVDFVEIGALTSIAPIAPQQDEPEPETDSEPETEDTPEDIAEPEASEADLDVTRDQSGVTEPAEPDQLLPDFESSEAEDRPEKAEPAETQRQSDPLADFLNQSESTFRSEIETRKAKPEVKTASLEPKPELKDAPAPPKKLRKGAGDRKGNVARLEALIQSRIYNECWQGVDDQPNPERLNVQMRLLLNQNGTIADLRLVSPKQRPIGRSPVGTAIDRALRAVNKCAPYRLPSEDYASWQEVNVYLGLGFANKK